MEEVSTLTDTMQLASRSRIHILRHTRTSSHKDRIISSTEKTVDGHIVLAYHTIGNKLNAQCLNLAHLIAHHTLWQTILRNTIHQDTTRFSLTFKDGYIEALTSQITGNRQTSRTRTDDSHTTTSLLRKFLTRQLHLRIEISNKLLQLTNLYRFTLLAQDTMTLALLLMRANTSADSRQVALFIDDRHGSSHITHRQLVYEIRNVIFYRTSFTALWDLTMKTTLSLLDCLTGRKALVYNLESSC